MSPEVTAAGPIAASQPIPESELRANGALRIVLATYRLDQPGGSESYLLTVAHQLQRLGHDVTVFAEEVGPTADLAEREGLRVSKRPQELPRDCDAVVTQDAIVTAPVLAQCGDARVVHVAHSELFDHQLPVLIGGVVDALVVLCDRTLVRGRALALDVPIVRLRQPIDTTRFAAAGTLPARPRRVLLVGNYLEGARRRALIEAWEPAGLEFEQVGAPTQPELDVLPAIARADIVVGKARAALEAMSCARAVYVFDQFGGDGWVTKDNYEALEADGFAGLATSSPRSPEEIAEDLTGYRPSMGWVNQELIRTHHSAQRHALELVEVLRGEVPGRGRDLTALDEISRLSLLRWHAEHRAGALWREVGEARQDATQAREQERAAAAELEAWAGRALSAERELRRAQELLATRRVRAGRAAGRALDRLRGRR